MKKKKITELYLSIGFLSAFIIWTIALTIFDVSAIGPNHSKVGFSRLNEFIRELVDVNFTLYTITDWLGLVPIGFALGFAVLGLIQLVKRKSILKVDKNLLILGTFYIVVIIVYLLFENVVINFRPVLINGYLEASYPSSTTMLVTCVMPTSIMQLNARVKNKVIKNCIVYTMVMFIIFMVVGRVLSGVHWFSDVVGGLLLSAGLVIGYHFFVHT